MTTYLQNDFFPVLKKFPHDRGFVQQCCCNSVELVSSNQYRKEITHRICSDLMSSTLASSNPYWINIEIIRFYTHVQILVSVVLFGSWGSLFSTTTFWRFTESLLLILYVKIGLLKINWYMKCKYVWIRWE